MGTIKVKLVSALIAIAVGPISVMAVPAFPGVIKSQQPDGSIVEIRIHGDERANWVTTPEGYTLLRDSCNYWNFAIAKENGTLQSSGIVYRNDVRPAHKAGIKPGLKFPKEQLSLSSKSTSIQQRSASPQLQVEGTYPSIGQNKLLMLLLNYADTQPEYTQSDFDNLMNLEGYGGIGCFRDYYLENSYEKLDITTTVTRWVTLPYDKSHYGSDRAIEMIQDALYIIDEEIDLNEFDNDGDGILDGLAVIHQGAGQEYTAGADDIWSHSSVIYGMEFDGVQLRRYTIMPELLGNTGRQTTIGVICHEFGHNLGSPDFYDSDYSNSGGEYPGTGKWDLMGNGAWNGDMGDRPAGINMWQKIQSQWVTPIMLDESQSIEAMPEASSNAVAYRFDTTVPGEYFIVENRQQVGNFDVALPGHGLIIYHADESLIRQAVANNTLNVSYPQAMYTVCASAGEEPSDIVSSYGDINSPSSPFPGAMGVTTFNDTSLPSLKSNSGRYSYKALNNISESLDGLISFDFSDSGAPLAPINLKAVAERGLVTISWDMPEEAQGITHFNVYRNNESIAFTMLNSFTDRGITDETLLTYNVDAVYTNGLVSPYSSVTIRIPSNKVSDIIPSVIDSSVELKWSIDNKLTRMTDIKADYIKSSYDMSTLDYVHRFRVEDLLAYKGYKINQISFLPYQSQSEVTFTIRVWEADADGANPKIVSERVVKEFGTAVWRDYRLTKAVEITGEKELWIGVHCQSNTKNVQILTERENLVGSYGNWIKYEGGEWQEDNIGNGNFFLYASLTEPEAGDYSPMSDCGQVDNVDLDLYYPIGYSVYRDGQLLGWTSSRRFIDGDPLLGVHTYAVACLYKGANESVAGQVEVTYEISAIEDELVDTDSTIVAVEYFNLQGVRLSEEPDTGFFLLKKVYADGAVTIVKKLK